MYIVTGYRDGQVVGWSDQSTTPLMVADWSVDGRNDAPLAVLPVVGAGSPNKKELIGLLAVTESGRLRIQLSLPEGIWKYDKELPIPDNCVPKLTKPVRWSRASFDGEFGLVVVSCGYVYLAWSLPSPGIDLPPQFIGIHYEHQGQISSLRVSTDNNLIVSGSADDQVHVTPREPVSGYIGSSMTTAVLRKLIGHEGHTAPIIDLAVTGATCYSIGGPRDGRLRVWTLRTTQHRWKSVPISDDLTCVRIVVPFVGKGSKGIAMFGTGAGDVLAVDRASGRPTKITFGKVPLYRVLGLAEVADKLIIVTEGAIYLAPRAPTGAKLAVLGATTIPIVCTNI